MNHISIERADELFHSSEYKHLEVEDYEFDEWTGEHKYFLVNGDLVIISKGMEGVDDWANGVVACWSPAPQTAPDDHLEMGYEMQTEMELWD